MSFALGFVLTLLMVGLLRPVALHIGLIDQPGERKVHSDGVPLVGGLAMFCGFAIAALTLEQAFTPYRSFFAAVAVLMIVGVLDDMRELSSRSRFAAQIIAAAMMAWWGGIVLEDLGALGGGARLIALGILAVPFTIFATVGVINALNMIDGMDGLAGGLSLVALAGLAFVAHDAGLSDRRDLLLLLCVCVLAFLVFNVRAPGRSQALVFMGDAGSMFLGFAITWFFIDMSQGPGRVMSPVTALWLLLIPLFDTVWLLIRRPLTGRLPTAADAEHVHHVLQMIGLGVNQTFGLLMLLAAGFAVAGIAASKLAVPESAMFWIFIAMFVAYCATMATAWRRMRLFGISMERRVLVPDRRVHAERRIAERR
ncbi:MAG: MraY family glycosyltransferase, partial [Gammaproteobacteria bacterium]|nr:MraY family glycosyltransferase [Gammaproteobacteria bacterium]